MITPVLFLLTGCFPVYKTLQPDVNFTVIDESQKPVTGAEVNLITSSYPYGFEKFRNKEITGNNGKASFNSKNQMRVEILMPHGREFFFWNWCISKDGYETNSSSYGSGDDFLSNQIIILKKGVSSSCPAAPVYQHQQR